MVFNSHLISAQNLNPVITLPYGSYFEYNYSCREETHEYVFDIPAFKLSNLVYGMSYLVLGVESTIFDYVDPEPYPQLFNLNGGNWTWLSPTITTDTVYLVFSGNNSNLQAGAFEWIPIEFRPPYPLTPASAQVRVKIVAPYQISGSSLFCSLPVSFNLLNVPSSHTSISWQIKQGSSILSSGTGNTATANNLSNGQGQVIFYMDFTCGLNSLTYTKTFHYGPYSSSDYPIGG
jgi:hypothetical protein